MTDEWRGKSEEWAAKCRQLRALGYTYKEIAAKLGVPLATVYTDINGRYKAAESGKSEEQEEKELEGAVEECGAVRAVKRSVRPGKGVSFTRDGRTIEAVVIATYPFVVHCRDKRGLNYCPQYIDLAGGG